jgi:hypothetical protein
LVATISHLVATILRLVATIPRLVATIFQVFLAIPWVELTLFKREEREGIAKGAKSLSSSSRPSQKLFAIPSRPSR